MGEARRYIGGVPAQAILYAHDLDRLFAFYTEGVGLAPGKTGDGFRQLRADEFVLWLVRGQAPKPAVDEGGSALRRSNVPVKLGFGVASIDRAAPVIERLGGTLATDCWQFADYTRRDAIDPEGNVIQLLEPIDGEQ